MEIMNFIKKRIIWLMGGGMLILTSLSASAILTYSWPVPTYVAGFFVQNVGSAIWYRPHGVFISQTFTAWDWDENTTVAEAFASRGVSVGSRVFYGTYHIWDNDYFMGDSSLRYFSTDRTFKSFAETVNSEYGGTFAISQYSNVGQRNFVCFGFGVNTPTNGSGNWSNIRSALWDGYPNSTVGNPECIGYSGNLSQWCAMETSDIDFNFGTINRSEVAGKVLTKPVEVSCSSDVTFMLDLVNGNSIALSNGITAKLTVDGKPLGTSMQGSNGINQYQLSVQLSGEPREAGAFNGSGIIGVRYP